MYLTVSHEEVAQMDNHSDKGNNPNPRSGSPVRKEKEKKNSFGDVNLRFLRSNRSSRTGWWQRRENIPVRVGVSAHAPVVLFLCVFVFYAAETLCLPSFCYEFVAMILEQQYRNSLLEDCSRWRD